MKWPLILVLALISSHALGDSFDGVHAVSPGVQVTLADRKLEGILNLQNEFLKELEKWPERFTENERDRRFYDIVKEYKVFIGEHLNHIEAYVLYGKFLRMGGLVEEANRVFLEANRRDPGVAVVKQQIGNYLAERGDYGLALPYFLSAIEIEPGVAVYHYQLGELLSTFKESFLASRILTPEALDKQLLHAFCRAREIEGDSWVYQVRYAEAFYDIDRPRWEEALRLWKELEKLAPTVQEKEMVLLNEARVLIKLERYGEAKRCLANIFCREFEKSRRELVELIPNFDNI